MKGWKAFNSDLSCNVMQYEVKKTFKHDGELKLCSSGLHFHQNMNEYFNIEERNKDLIKEGE